MSGTGPWVVVRGVVLRNVAMLGLLALTAATGCRNACQNMCDRLADFSRECGVSVGEGEVVDCVDAFASAPSEDLATCRDFGSPQAIDNALSCDDMALIWGDAADGQVP